MTISKHSEAQIIATSQQVEAGRRAEGVARKQGVSKHTIYARKTKCRGMSVSEAQEVRQLREENARLKKQVAELPPDKDRLHSVIRKNCLNVNWYRFVGCAEENRGLARRDPKLENCDRGN